MKAVKMTLKERLTTGGLWPVRPMIRWRPGQSETLRIESGLHPLPDGERELDAAEEYFGDAASWGTVLSALEWRELAEWFVDGKQGGGL